VQAVGGGMASIALQNNTSTSTGTDIMVAGIVFQLASITIFVFCAADFFRRVLRHRLLASVEGSITPLLLAMVFSILLIYIRSIYRTIELVQGWTGYLITHEAYFIALDGSMMAPAVGIFILIHPAWFMPKPKSTGEYDEISLAAA
jgi:RTA1 like protein